VSEFIERFLEDQPPLVRSNLKMGVGMVVLVLVLHIAVGVAVRLVDANTMFEFNNLLNLFKTLVVLLILMMVINALRVLIAAARAQGVFTPKATILAVLSVGLVIIGLLNLPNIFARTLAQNAGRSYGDIYQDFHEHCTRWKSEWADKEDVVTFNPDRENLGRLAQEAQVFKTADTIIFDFSDSFPAYGFACTPYGDAPADSGRAYNYHYQKIADSEYRFIQDIR
jgi:hypothetical protein